MDFKHKSVSNSKNSQSMLPVELKPIILELYKNQLFMTIGDYLNDVPLQLTVDKLLLIDEICYRTKKDYYMINETVDKMVDKKYLTVKEGGIPDYFLSPSFAEAMKIKKIIDDEFKPLADEVKKDPDFQRYQDIDVILMDAIYQALCKA